MFVALAGAGFSALVVAAVVVTLALSLGSGEAAPATEAAELVPGSALLYLHVSTDASRPAVRRALSLSRRLPGSPLLFAAVTNRLDAILGGSDGAGVSFAADVRPWLGREAALAVLDTPGASAGSVIVLDVRDRPAARRFLSRVGAAPDGTYWGVPLLAQASGSVLAFYRHFLLVGQATSVQAALDVATGHVQSLAASPVYRRAAQGEPAGRVLDAYASAAGVRRALLPRSGLLGELGTLLDDPALSAAALSVSAGAGAVRVDVHRTLAPSLVAGLGDHPESFTAGLTDRLPAGSPLLLEVKGLRSAVPKLLRLAAQAGVGGRIGPLLSRLGTALRDQGVDVGQVMGIFSGEAGIGIVPGRGGSGPAPVIVAPASRPAQARSVLASLEGPLTQVFAPPSSGPGQVPEVTDTTVAGVPVHELSLAPGFRLDYAVARGLIVVSTSRAAVAGVFGPSRPLSGTPRFQRVLADRPSPLTSLVFFDLSQLLRLGEKTGLIGSSRQAMLWPAVEKIRAVGLAAWRGAYDTTTELRLQVR
jgi:hypothetical protein